MIVNIKDIIHDKRIELGLTYEELGKMVGVGKSTVRKWEKGMIENMRRDNIVALAKALNISPALIMGWDTEQIKEKKTFNDKEIKLIDKYRSLDDKGKHTVNTVLDMEYTRCNDKDDLLFAAHDKEGVDKNSPTYQQDNQHDIDVMMNDDEWK
nr:helix-turn-helix transcriptional regulator [Clostridium tyrobutyricum]